METLGFWASAIIVVVAIFKTLIYLFTDWGSMPGVRYTINDENNPTSLFYNNDDDLLTNPAYSDLTGNIWHESHDSSSSYSSGSFGDN